MRPALTYPWLESKVEHPRQTGNEQGCACCEHKQAEGFESRHKVRSAEPEQHLEAEHYGREADGAIVISAPATVVAASHIERPEKAGDQQGHPEDLRDLLT